MIVRMTLEFGEQPVEPEQVVAVLQQTVDSLAKDFRNTPVEFEGRRIGNIVIEPSVKPPKS